MATALITGVALAVGGILRGATGVGAALLAVPLLSLGLAQIPMLMNYGYLNKTNILLSRAALFPLVAAMPLGSLPAKHV